MPRESPVMTTVWGFLFSMAMAVAWVLPNHYRPWATFHSDAWMFGTTWIAFVTIVWVDRARMYTAWPRLAVMAIAVAFVPWMQFAVGMLHFSGLAWISSLYLLAFGMAIYIGARWEQWMPGQATALLFVAILIAGVLSVWLQLTTWLGMQSDDFMDIWSMGYDGSGRPYANMGQPNLLGSLLLMALVGVFWFVNTGVIRGFTASLLAAFLTIGIVLVQSRTAQLSLTVLTIWLFVFRSRWRSPKLGYCGLGVCFFYLVMAPSLKVLYSYLLDINAPPIRTVGLEDMRIQLWTLFASALWLKPFTGYGMTEVTHAQVAIADAFPSLTTTAAHSHNLYLDWMIWFGIPLGLLMAVAATREVLTYFLRTRSANDRIVQMSVIVLANHAMLELPLHHAFFLLPLGIWLGVMAQCSREATLRTVQYNVVYKPFGLLSTLAGVTAVAWAVTVVDYLRIESAYSDLRFELANIGVDKTGIGKPPNVLVLNHLRAWIWASRLNVGATLTADELADLDAITRRHPMPATVFRVTKAYATQGMGEQAQYWAQRWHHFMTPAECVEIASQWQKDAVKSPQLNQVNITCSKQQ